MPRATSSKSGCRSRASDSAAAATSEWRCCFSGRNSRLGISWSWPEMKPGEWVFESHAPVAFGELKQPLLLEVIPSATVAQPGAGGPGRGRMRCRRATLGASVKYGITSTMTLDATVNPDFSQVESDAFEVEVNQRYPVFFSEKRPFFMEGLGLFNLAGTGCDSDDAHGGAHPPHRGSQRRRQADGHGGPLHVRDAHLSGRIGRPRRSKDVHDWPRAPQLRRRRSTSACSSPTPSSSATTTGSSPPISR